MNKVLPKKQVMIERGPTSNMLQIHCVAIEGLLAAQKLEKRYCLPVTATNCLGIQYQIDNHGPFPTSTMMTVSKCYDYEEVFSAFEEMAESVMDGYEPVEEYQPQLSGQMKSVLAQETDGIDALDKALNIGYRWGQQDTEHKTELDVAYVPYMGHTPGEMIWILRSVYNEVQGDQLNFIKRIRKSKDGRLSRMNSFAMDVLFVFCKELSCEA